MQVNRAPTSKSAVVACAAGVYALISTGQCAGSEPLWVDNLSPLAGVLGIPSQRNAEVTPGWRLNLNSAIASQFVVDQQGDEAVFFDGETTRLSLAARIAVNERWDVALTVPYVRQASGFLDGVINDWHAAFGMSDGGRSLYPEDDFAYRYAGIGHALSVSEPQSGLGDVSVEVTRVVQRSAEQAVSVSLGYKFATGDAQSLLGSGAGDTFAALRFSGAHQGALPIMWHGQLGYTYAGEGDLLGPDQRRHLWFAGLGLDWRLSEAWSLLAQYDGHAAPLNSELTSLGGVAALVSVGARWRADAQWAIDFSFVEDIRVETGPDVTFQMNIRYLAKP